MLSKRTPILSAFLVPVAIEFMIAVVFASDLQTTFTRLAYVLLIPLAIFLALALLQPLVRRQVLLMAIIQAGIGVAITVVGAQTSVTTQPFHEPISTGLAISGPAIVVTSIYLIVADLRFLDIHLVPPGRVRRPHHHTRRIDDGEIAYARTVDGAGQSGELLDDCFKIVSVRDVHFVAAFYEGTCQFYVDVLPSPKLAAVVSPLNPEGRRVRFERAGRQLMALDSRVAAGFGRIERGTLVRAMLDVEDGALFLYRLSRGHYLIGATLHQPQILRAQRRLDALALKYQRFPNGGPDVSPARVRDLATDYPSVGRAAPASHAARLIADEDLPGVLVLDGDGRPFATLCGADLLRVAVPGEVRDDPPSARLIECGHTEFFGDRLKDLTVAQCLPKPVPEIAWVSPGATALEAAAVLVGTGSPLAAVGDDATFLGVISLNSLIDLDGSR